MAMPTVPGRVTPDIGNTKDPVLRPWPPKQMQESNDEVLSGKRGPSLRRPVDLPSGRRARALLTPAEPSIHPDSQDVG